MRKDKETLGDIIQDIREYIVAAELAGVTPVPSAKLSKWATALSELSGAGEQLFIWFTHEVARVQYNLKVCIREDWDYWDGHEKTLRAIPISALLDCDPEFLEATIENEEHNIILEQARRDREERFPKQGEVQ